MATAPSNPSPMQQHSPRAAVEGSASSSSPSRRLGGTGAVGSPWNQIVRGSGDFESTISSSLTTVPLGVVPPSSMSGVSQEQIMTMSPDGSPTKAAPTATEAAPFSSLPEDASETNSDGTDNGSGGNGASKKPAWSKPSSKGGTDVGPVMGAVSWPALSESTRPSPKSSSDSLKTLSDISVSAPQVPPPTLPYFLFLFSLFFYSVYYLKFTLCLQLLKIFFACCKFCKFCNSRMIK